MHWTSASEFFSMGGYALYVWGSYGVTLLLLGGEVLMLLNRRRNPPHRDNSHKRETQHSKLETVL